MSVTLAYSGLLVENCEDAWTAGAHVTCSQESTIKKIGTYSAKQITSGAGANELLCYEDISSLDLSGKTHIAIWMRSSLAFAAGDLQLLLDNTSACASPLEAINIPAIASGNVDKQHRFIIPIAIPANCSAIVSVGIKQITNLADFTFYIDDVRAFNGLTVNLPTCVIGVNDYEKVEDRTIDVEGLDFSYSSLYVTSRRNPFVDLGCIPTKADRATLLAFEHANDKSLFYGNDEVFVEGKAVIERLEDFIGAINYSYQFIEKTPWTTIPESFNLT